MGQESDRMLRELVEKEAIRDVVHRYCWAVDREELQDVMALFHEPCDLVVSPPGRRREGRAPRSSAGTDAICAIVSGSYGISFITRSSPLTVSGLFQKAILMRSAI